jgi:hypothetical protein
MGRPKKPENEKLVPASLTIHPTIDAELDKILESDGRTKGQLIRLIFMRGWQAYKKDGKLINGAPFTSAYTEGSKRHTRKKKA